MQAVFLWLLLSTDVNGQVVIVERFPTIEQCEKIKNSAPVDNMPSWKVRLRCVQAQVIISK
jgi:hypothetical protein